MCRVTMGHLRLNTGHLRVTVGHPRVTIGHLRLTIGYLRQSRLMLEALEAPLADSRAAAVNIRLISCIGRQAKIGFCLQTRNSFNLLCAWYGVLSQLKVDRINFLNCLHTFWLKIVPLEHKKLS